MFREREEEKKQSRCFRVPASKRSDSLLVGRGERQAAMWGCFRCPTRAFIPQKYSSNTAPHSPLLPRMSLPTTPLRAATRSRSPLPKNATLKKPAPNFLGFIFQPSPKPINCCTQFTTREYLANPSHPYHIKVSRRMAAFDASKLHWSVGAVLDVAKKRVVRSWVTRRVREAVREELKSRGWARDGSVLAQDELAGIGKGKEPLRGALKIFMATDRRQAVITATGDEVRENVRAILNEVVRRQVPLKEERSPLARGDQKPLFRKQIGNAARRERGPSKGGGRGAEN